MKPAHEVTADDLETQQAATIFGLASRYFEAAADMMRKGAPYRDPEVQRMVHAGYERLAEVRDKVAVGA